MGLQYESIVMHHCAACAALRHSGRFDLISSSAHSPNVLRDVSAFLAIFFASKGSIALGEQRSGCSSLGAGLGEGYSGGRTEAEFVLPPTKAV
jgi:hypothetical protein